MNGKQGISVLLKTQKERGRKFLLKEVPITF